MLQQLPKKRREERRRRPPDAKERPQTAAFLITCRFSERKGLAVKQGTIEEKGLSEMILLSWSSRSSSGLENLSLFKSAANNFSSGGSNSFASLV